MKLLFLIIICLGLNGLFNSAFSQAPNTSGNVMYFSSISDYEYYAGNDSLWSSLSTLATSSSTLTTLQENTDIDDEDTVYAQFLRIVLNTDSILRIGNYYIKIDPVNDRALIIVTANGLTSNYNNIANNNLSATGMIILGANDQEGLEVLEALSEQTINASNYQEWLEGRTCRHATSHKDKLIPTWNSDLVQCDVGGTSTTGRSYGLDRKVVYQKLWIFFSLQSKMRSLIRCTYGGTWTGGLQYDYVDINLNGTVKYKKRCGTEVSASVDMFEYALSGGDGLMHWRPYSGGRSLSHYEFSVDFSIREVADRNVNPNPWFISNGYIMDGY